MCVSVCVEGGGAKHDLSVLGCVACYAFLLFAVSCVCVCVCRLEFVCEHVCVHVCVNTTSDELDSEETGVAVVGTG